jgi:prolyl oligopeptidase
MRNPFLWGVGSRVPASNSIMPALIQPPPATVVEPVSEVLHGHTIVDPFRWLEDHKSTLTRDWIEMQTDYARGYLDQIGGRDQVCDCITEYLTTEDYDSLHKAGNRYFYRKRLPSQEQGCIYMREGDKGDERILVDPATKGTGHYTAIKPTLVSSNGRLLLYEVKRGGERASEYEIFDVDAGLNFAESFPRGYLYAFVFSHDGKSCYYVHEPAGTIKPSHRIAYQHVFGTPFTEDREMFRAEGSLHLCLVSDATRLGFIVYRCAGKTLVDFYLGSFSGDDSPRLIVKDADYKFYPFLIPDHVLALTDLDAPNSRIVEVLSGAPEQWPDVIPESNRRIFDCHIVGDQLFVLYARESKTEIAAFDFCGRLITTLPIRDDETARLIASSPTSDELFIEQESFTEPPGIFRYSVKTGQYNLWSRRSVPIASADYAHVRLQYSSADGTPIPIFLMGNRDVLEQESAPVIMTSYGGFGLSMTPQFSVFVAFLVERGCVFAMPNIRGGSEFGAQWHEAAKRHSRQKAYADFIAAAEWLIATRRAIPDKIAIFGGSNSGLLVGVAITQRPELFRAAVCMVPLLDMLRYHHFDCADLWREEYGTAEDPDDFSVLFNYSPYHQVRTGVAYPGTLIVSGDADQNCNSMHARKMVARLQLANASDNPIVLSYNPFRGHSPVLPLSDRIEALTDRMAFLSDQLGLPVEKESPTLCRS